MKFSDLDSKMRIYETAHDVSVLPGMYIVARLDGRGFTKLTKEELDFERPFDVRFRDAMVDTVEHLMRCGPKIVYGYTQSDEISLLFDLGEELFNRKLRKLNSILASEASANFSLKLGRHATFDCRISQLPNQELVRDYFSWRIEDASRNALSAYCYWTERDAGATPNQAYQTMLGLSVSEKNELLFSKGINFNDLPAWQKRGVGLFWETYEKAAKNPKTGEDVTALRRRLSRNLELPRGDDYRDFVTRLASEPDNRN